MAAIITGTVVEWKEDDREIRVKNSEDIPIYVVNENMEALTVVPAIIATYIIDRAAEKISGETLASLLEAARKGLLQVVGTRRTVVTPPSTFGAISS